MSASARNGKSLLPFGSLRAEQEAISARQAAWRMRIMCNWRGGEARRVRLACLISDAEKYRIALGRATEAQKGKKC